MIAALENEIRLIRWNVIYVLRNKLGLTREEAKRIFNQFRSPGAPPPESPGNSPEFREVMKHMQETSVRLDRIEKDLEYLKRQVDRILEQV